MNFFSSSASAERYVNGRPDFHANTINRIIDFLQIEDKLEAALDIACGTGLSTKALLPIASQVYGTDISPEMLNVAVEKDKIHYLAAAAEDQPFDNEEFDLITVSSGVHWFNIDAFLNEANRILKQDGWLVIYENYFTGKMPGNNDFKKWVDETYLSHFPSPPRNKNYDWSDGNLKSKKFSPAAPDEFENEIGFTKSQLISYLTSQSNVIAAIIAEKYTYPEADAWLDDELQKYFGNDNEVQTFVFGNRIKYLQKM